MTMRGACPRCGYSVRIRKNHYPERHYLYTTQKWACPGGEEMRRPDDKPDAPVAEWVLSEEER